MPTYDYECSACGHKFDKFQSITADPIKKCPECGQNTVRRLVGIGAGIIFKGGGFYETDYRSESYKSDAKKDSGDTSDSKSESKSGSKSDAKTETKASESKPATEAKPAAKADAPAKSESKAVANQ